MPDRQSKVLPLKVPEGTPTTTALTRGGWPARLAEIWAPFGDEKPGHLGKALAGVVRQHGAERTAHGLQRWLAAGRAAFGPEVFARECVTWINGTGRAAGNTRTAGLDAQVASLIGEARREGR